METGPWVFLLNINLALRLQGHWFCLPHIIGANSYTKNVFTECLRLTVSPVPLRIIAQSSTGLCLF